MVGSILELFPLPGLRVEFVVDLMAIGLGTFAGEARSCVGMGCGVALPLLESASDVLRGVGVASCVRSTSRLVIETWDVSA
jgi:hypothetical protein